jgi:hypothetical protein
MDLEADAVAVAAGELQVVQEAGALQFARDTPERPVPLAAHQTDGWFSVFFVFVGGDGVWRDEIVPVVDGKTRLSGGAAGALFMPSREEVLRGAPRRLGDFGQPAGSTHWYLAVHGVSADETVRMWVDGTQMARAEVAAHGWFLLTALVPGDGGQEWAVEVTP